MNRWKVLMFVAAVCGAGCADAIDDKTETGDAIDLTEGGEVDVNNDVEPAARRICCRRRRIRNWWTICRNRCALSWPLRLSVIRG